MASIKRWTPILIRGSKILGIRNLHVSSHLRAYRPPKRAPKVAQAQRAAQGKSARGTTVIKRETVVEESMPPISMLNSARKAGAIDVEPEKALEFLAQYHGLSEGSKQGWERDLCEEHRITPMTVTVLAGILRRRPNKPQQLLARSLMLSASALGEKSATFELIQSAINQGRIRDYTEPLRRLGILAKIDNDPGAMMLLGKVLLSQGKESEALEWLRKATQEPTGSLEVDGAGDALVHEGRILLSMKKKDQAEIAFRKAALELDEPSGYFYLSQLQEPGSSNQQVYLLKAASSGILEACHNLGAIELAKIERQERKPGTLDDYGMAREWFQVAAMDGFGLSMLNLALMHKAVGEEEHGMKWLERAEELPAVRQQAENLKRQWSEDRISLP